ncbi:Arylsulfatase [Rosistilla ulvae]|uniref:Arylsulfatase n=1 Tax=Rosistilla ulvae TaxID=1930277 RepID=A0A517LZJ6_9BACT|nr:sulfatase [Rosistilla ulvae]QDS88048.1 Arylsulfatase [Rosistilla ulvae]
MINRVTIWASSIAIMLVVTGDVVQAADDRKPNIVFIMADDLGWADVGYNGAEFYETPNIDALCRSGMEFTDAYPGAANCMPSRSCIMSGMYTPRTKMWTPGMVSKGEQRYMRLLVPSRQNNKGDGKIPTVGSLDPEVFSLARLLKQVDYKTLHLGKWHLGSGSGLGFDRNDVDGRGADLKKDHKFYGNKNVAQWLTDAAVDYIAKNKDDPFFIYLNHFDVHTPINARAAVVDKYKRKLASKKWSRNWNPVYAAMIEAVDTSVGRLRQAIQENGIEQETLVIFTSDNGGYGRATWNTPLKGSKGGFYEGGIRTPLVMSWHGKIKPGTVCDTPVTGVDYMPTFAELTGAPLATDQPLDGVSIVPLMMGNAIARRAIYWHYPLYLNGEVQVKPIYGTDRMYWRGTPCSVIRMGDWKLMEFFETGSIELYNLRDDLGESSDLADQHPEKAAELLKVLKKWQVETDADIPRTLNPDFDPDYAPAGKKGAR